MNNSLKTAYANLSAKQKVGLLFVVQVIIIIIIASILHVFLQPKEHIDIYEENRLESNIPKENMEYFKRTLWDLISRNESSVSESIIDDVKIREGTYSETEHENGRTANFIIDIDSIKQTYTVSLGWSDNKNKDDEIAYNDIVINCPPQNQMKYPETVCRGMYNDTHSLDLYLPWQIESPFKDRYDFAGPEVYVYGDEFARTITVSLAPCNSMEENKKKANEYIQTIPNYKKYQIKYEVQDHIDVVCAEDL